MSISKRPAFASNNISSSLILLLIGILCLFLADIEVITHNPALEFKKMLTGLLHPTLLPWAELFEAVSKTISYALLAVSFAAISGFIISLCYKKTAVRIFCATIRSVHELFWGLLFIQLVGIHPLAGFLAIAIPYSGIFAKVFAEILEENKPSHLYNESISFSQFSYCQLPPALPHFINYFNYRLECGLRSSTVLGFIGLPTLGFHLETAFMQGLYDQVAGLLLLFFLLIAVLRYWAKWQLIPIYIPIAIFVLWPENTLTLSLNTPIFYDFIPSPLRTDQTPLATTLLPWLSSLSHTQIIPGITNTLIVTQIALVFTAVMALILFPLSSKQFNPPPIRYCGHILLVVLRSTPELIIAFSALLLWGPSMLPAIIALSIHNSAIIAHLMARHSDQIQLRIDASHKLNRYSFEILPRLHGQFLAFLCYRWEVIQRESALLGILGIHTLGFYIDSAFESFRLDVALLLIIVTALLNITVDQLSRWLRHRLHIKSTPFCRTPISGI